MKQKDGFLLGVLSNPEDGSDMFFRNVDSRQKEVFFSSSLHPQRPRDFWDF
jgi:hypothetical protein